MRTGRRDIERYTEARRLRTAGTPYKRIAVALDISPATALAWTRDIVLTVEQEEQNRRGPLGPHSVEAQRRAVEARSDRCRGRRADAQSAGRKRAKGGDLLHQAGCMLYWAEGGKSRNSVRFANSDPQMVLMFRRFLTDSLGIERQDIRISINTYTNNGLSIDRIERFWLDLLDLPGCCVRKHTLNHMPTSSSGRAKNRLRHGVCFLIVHSTAAVQHIYGAIQEYAGFDEPRWLD